MKQTNTTPEGIDLDKLEALARAATPGPWLHRCDRSNKGAQHCLKLQGEQGPWIADCIDNADSSKQGGIAGERNARFIAAANPATVLELIARARAAQPEPAVSEQADERALFQAHLAAEGWNEMHFERYNIYDPEDERSYKSRHVSDMWDGWQARADIAHDASSFSQSSCAPGGVWINSEGRAFGRVSDEQIEVVLEEALADVRKRSELASSAPVDIPDRISTKWLREIAQDAGFVLTQLDELVVPSPHYNAEPYLRRLIKLIRTAATPASAQPADDVRRYQRLRILGAAPFGSKQLESGTVLRFQGIDDFLDADLAAHPSRGEAASAQPADVNPLKSTSVDPQKCADAENNGAQPVAAAPAEALMHAGAKMANTMFNLAQRPGECIDAKLAVSMKEMQAEWDAAVRAPTSAAPAAAVAPPVAADDATQAARDVLAERRRQVEAEGMTNDGDDHYHTAELPRAAASYILNGSNDEAPYIWPWAKSWWKPRDARANYVRAGALILAEIERIDRAVMTSQQGQGGGDANSGREASAESATKIVETRMDTGSGASARVGMEHDHSEGGHHD